MPGRESDQGLAVIFGCAVVIISRAPILFCALFTQKQSVRVVDFINSIETKNCTSLTNYGSKQPVSLVRRTTHGWLRLGKYNRFDDSRQTGAVSAIGSPGGRTWS